MSRRSLSIGALASQTGCSTPTIRYYEQIGILPPADRRANGRRNYAADDVQRLAFVKRCRDFGFSLEEVRVLLGLSVSQRRSCDAAREVAERHLASVQSKLVELLVLEQDLRRFIDRSIADCAATSDSNCALLRNLGAPQAQPRATMRED